MVFAAPAAQVDGPVRQPFPFGLFSVVSLSDASSERWENGVEWQGFPCTSDLGVIVADCDSPEGFPKVFPQGYGPDADATAFTVYAPFLCNPIGGLGLAGAQERARELLELREESAVESRLWDKIEDGATSLGADLSPTKAISLAEQWLADNYGSLGIIHASRDVGVYLESGGGGLSADGRQMKTGLGTPVVVGSGYPAGSLAVTPAMFGYRSDIFEASNRSGDLLNTGTNQLYGIAERTYLIGIDPCGTATATIVME